MLFLHQIEACKGAIDINFRAYPRVHSHGTKLKLLEPANLAEKEANGNWVLKNKDAKNHHAPSVSGHLPSRVMMLRVAEEFVGVKSYM